MIGKNVYKFAPAAENESIVFGAARPGYRSTEVAAWIRFMRQQGIQRVCCLLAPEQLIRYSDLLGTYRQEFGAEKVCSAPIPDFQLSDPDTLIQIILPFLTAASQMGEPVVVHCSGGIGRTGHVLAAWLVRSRGCSNRAAIAAVQRTGRNPSEAAIVAPLRGKNPFTLLQELHQLLDACRLSS